MRLAVIPARGGSKRIPRKNIKTFHGKPMIAWSIEVAFNSGCFDEVWVSTDDDEIAEIAIKYGAKVPFMRPLELSEDYSTTTDVMQHAIQYYMDNNSKELSFVCCIYATAPFITIDALQLGLQKIENSDLSFVFGATTYPFPIQRAIKLSEQGTVKMFSPQYFNSRSQDLEVAWHDAGQFYWARPQAYLEKEIVFSSKSSVVEIPRYLVQDIDTMEDWMRAELIFSCLK